MVLSHVQPRAAIIAPRNGITLPTNRKASSPQHGCWYRPRLMANQERIIITRVHNEVEQRAGEATHEEKRTLYGCLSSKLVLLPTELSWDIGLRVGLGSNGLVLMCSVFG